MFADELMLLVKDKAASAEQRILQQMLPGSLTEKVMSGWFGEGSRQYLIYKKAKEMASVDVGYFCR